MKTYRQEEIFVHAYKPIRALAERVYTQCEEGGFDHENFADIATQSLSNFKHYEEINPSSIATWLLSGETPKQFNVFNVSEAFGQPPVTLFSCSHFIIDAYFWTSHDTQIHGHEFSGAFKVVSGKTRNIQYDFYEQENYNHQLLLGDLVESSNDLLDDPDQVVTILPGEQFIHSTEHLVEPTITLCVRTKRYPGVIQYGYYPAGIAVTGQQNIELARIFELIMILRKQCVLVAREYCKVLLDKLSVTEIFQLLLAYVNHTNDVYEANLLLEYIASRYPLLAEKLHTLFLVNDSIQ